MKTRLFPVFVVASWLAAAPPQIAVDSPGVTVKLTGAEVLHRAGVAYPLDAARSGIQGTVSLQVKIDSSGVVNDANVLSGPEELRKAVLQSVLRWQFSQEAAGSTRVLDISFAAPKTAAAISAPEMTPVMLQAGKIHSIRVQNLSPQAAADLLASLPIHEGDQWNAQSAQKAAEAVRAFDEHFVIGQRSMSQSPDGAVEVDLVISQAPQRIRVGGNVQSSMIASKVAPVYPAAAKAAAIQGNVQLSALIGADGTVQELRVVDGPPELTQAAMDAVKQWVYMPTLLNGNPVQVQTTINVNFTLAK